MTFEDLVNKVLDDKSFWTELKSDPAAALKKAGVKASPKAIAALKRMDYKSVQNVAKALEDPDSSVT